MRSCRHYCWPLCCSRQVAVWLVVQWTCRKEVVVIPLFIASSTVHTMRLTTILATLLLVASVSAIPSNCKGRRCRTRVNPSTTVTPDDTTDPLPAAPLSRPPLKRPVKTTTESVTEAATEAVTDPVTEEIRRAGVNGWLAAPTPAPSKSRTTPTTKADKPGLCETPKGFGIKCMSGLDQCKEDGQCPGSTKCCMVGECGKLCVKPKPTSTEAKEPTKESEKNEAKKNKEAKENTSEKLEEEETETQRPQDLSGDAVEDTTNEEDNSEIKEVKNEEIKVEEDNENEEREDNIPTEVSTATEDSTPVDESTDNTTEA
ncbi:uncharacterized protein LOC121861637 [Homarus americanus]|uniref:uncharacterized protein LOC121861637 n=1 Tax=Homarus americanus TaxID=6706 RepID=UPI001C468C07|nr:uncharacterized protein LOC121861637 [Homarus americanus]